MHAKVVYIRDVDIFVGHCSAYYNEKEIQELISTKTYPKSYG